MLGWRRTTILLVDEQPLFRGGLVSALLREPDFEVVGETNDGHNALELLKRSNPDIVVLDVILRTMSGIELAARIKQTRPSCRMLALSAIDQLVVIARMLDAGAGGYALKTSSDDIVAAIRSVLAGHRFISSTISSEAVEAERAQPSSSPFQRLTKRELEVFDLLIRGHTNDQIGAKLRISRRTVETHRLRVMSKLSAHTLLDMLRLAARYGTLHDVKMCG